MNKADLLEVSDSHGLKVRSKTKKQIISGLKPEKV